MKFYTIIRSPLGDITKSLKDPRLFAFSRYGVIYITCCIFISFTQKEIMQIVGSDIIAECSQLCSLIPKIFQNLHRKRTRLLH